MSRFALALLSLLLLEVTPLPSRTADQQSDESRDYTGSAQTWPTAAPTQLQPNATPKPCGTQNQAQNWYKWFWPPVWSSWVLIFVAACAACIAIRQINKADEALRLDQRAWVVPMGKTEIGFRGSIGIIPKGGTGFPIRVYLKNTGKTPARNLRIRVDSGILPAGSYIADPQYPLGQPQPHVIGAIGPGAIFDDWWGSPPIDEAHYLAFQTGGHWFAVWGHIEYIDCFDQPHETKFFLVKPGPPLNVGTCISGPYNDCT